MNKPLQNNYTATIGIECHVQLHTATKLFAAVANDARDAVPNSLVSHICFGMPGALPVLNGKVVEHAARFAFAFGVAPQKYSYFERKHYFYPDLPKGYQITQLDHPIIVGGNVEIVVDGQEKSVRINRVQIEEDAGKNTHPVGADYSLVDLNRAGTPLFEIVSEPDMHTPEEAKAFVRELYLLVRYAGVSDADLYHGNMRFDVNVSVSKTDELGTRTETKNLNSFKSVEKAAAYEIDRQIALLESGEAIVQETRGWDDTKQKTVSQRGKEQAHDYRYFPDPDLPPIVLSDDQIKLAEASLPTMPGEWRKRMSELGLSGGHVETLLEAELEVPAVSYLEHIQKHIKDKDTVTALANLFVNVEIPFRRDEATKVELDDQEGRKLLYSAVLSLLGANKLSSTNAKTLIQSVLASSEQPANIEEYAAKQGLVQESDEAAINKIVVTVLEQNKSAADDVRAGEMKAIGFLVGQVMKASHGKANPKLAQELIKKQVGL